MLRNFDAFEVGPKSVWYENWYDGDDRKGQGFMLNGRPHISTLTLATDAVQIPHNTKTIEGKPSTDIDRHDSCNNPNNKLKEEISVRSW